jgi:hypothetical protein
MFCPMCGDEYRAGFDRCGDCDTALVQERPPPPQPPGDVVTVLETGSQSLVAVARSILDGAGIPYIARNDRLQNLFGWGSIGTGFNVAMGVVRLQVPPEREREARALLTELPEPLADEGDA